MQRETMRRTDRRGFTLIELLVVIAIIAILAAILFPVFAQAREKARTAQSGSNARQIGLAIRMYVQDYDEMFPMGHWRPGMSSQPGAKDTGNYGGGGDGTWDWQNSTAPYIKNKGVYYCPSSTDDTEDPADPTYWQWNLNPVSYLYNAMLDPLGNPASDATVVAAADCWMVMDGHSDWGTVNQGTKCCLGTDWMGRPHTVWLYDDTTMGDAGSLITGWLSWQGFTWGVPRHMGGANICYTDGHVKYQKMAPGSVPMDVPTGNNLYRSPGAGGWLEQTYPHQKVAQPDQSDPTWKWYVN